LICKCSAGADNIITAAVIESMQAVVVGVLIESG
jgi:hypothetical protein